MEVRGRTKSLFLPNLRGHWDSFMRPLWLRCSHSRAVLRGTQNPVCQRGSSVPGPGVAAAGGPPASLPLLVLESYNSTMVSSWFCPIDDVNLINLRFFLTTKSAHYLILLMHFVRLWTHCHSLQNVSVGFTLYSNLNNFDISKKFIVFLFKIRIMLLF